MTKSLLWRRIVTVAFAASRLAYAIDAPEPQAFHWDDENSLQQEEFRNILVQKLQQFDSVYSQIEHDNRDIVNEECIPCDSSALTHHHRHRMLALFPKLRQGIKKIVNDATTTTTSTGTGSSDELMNLFLQSESEEGNRLFGGGGNSTMGGLFGSLAGSPFLLVGGIALALVIILPLALLEITSITTSTPVLCILGFAESSVQKLCHCAYNLE
jgi:hypothetical protein